MKRPTYHTIGPALLLILALALVACVRPVPGQTEGGETDGTSPGETFPLPTLTPQLVIPDLSPSPTPLPPATVETPPDPQPEPTAAAAAVTLPTTHTVQTGETVDSISQLYGVPADQIMTANGIKGNNTLTAGQVLTIPAPGTSPPPTGGGEQTYVVQPGNNLFRIGLQYGCTAAQLAQYNGIPNMTLIHPGQVIRIPPNC